MDERALVGYPHFRYFEKGVGAGIQKFALSPFPKNNCPIGVMDLGIGLRSIEFIVDDLIFEMA